MDSPHGTTGQAADFLRGTTLLTEKQAAERLQLSVRTLQSWRVRSSTGPPFIKAGRSVRYRLSDLDVWLEGRLRLSTSDPGSSDSQVRP
jgi:predicted DNA-binding transcriptional regulator AlpA